MQRVSQEEPWAKIPHWVVMHPDLDASAIRVYAVLSKYANRARNAYPGIRKIAEGCHCAKSTVQRSLDALEAVGAIVVTRTFHGKRPQVNLYHLPMTRFGLLDGPIVGTYPKSMGRTSVHDGPIGDTPDVPIVGTDQESKNQRTREFETEEPNIPRLPGESHKAYMFRVASLISKDLTGA